MTHTQEINEIIEAARRIVEGGRKPICIHEQKPGHYVIFAMCWPDGMDQAVDAMHRVAGDLDASIDIVKAINDGTPKPPPHGHLD